MIVATALQDSPKVLPPKVLPPNVLARRMTGRAPVSEVSSASTGRSANSPSRMMRKTVSNPGAQSSPRLANHSRSLESRLLVVGGREETACQRDLRIAEDGRRLAVFDDASVIEHDDPAGDPPHHARFMSDENDGEAELAVDVAQQCENGGGRLGIERGGRFVGQEERGVGRERARDADALLLPTRELAGISRGLVLKANQPQQRSHPVAALGLRPPRDLERKRDIVGDSLGRQQVEVLEDHADPQADPAQGALAERRDVLAKHLDATRCRASRARSSSG